MQGYWVVLVCRLGRWRYGLRPVVMRKAFSLLYKLLCKFIQVVTGIEFPCEVKVGNHFVIDHFGGIVVSGYARFGDNCRIRSGVVVGLARVEDPCAPVCGDSVDIGTGTKLPGRFTVGDNVQIGAHSVVTRDVPSNSIAVGVPARVMPRLDIATPRALQGRALFNDFLELEAKRV